MDRWQALKSELQKQAEAISESSGEIVQLESRGESDLELTLISGTREMNLQYLRERNAVRWETPDEYGFERIPETTGRLAAQLIQWALER